MRGQLNAKCTTQANDSTSQKQSGSHFLSLSCYISLFAEYTMYLLSYNKNQSYSVKQTNVLSSSVISRTLFT